VLERDFAGALRHYGRELAPTAENLGLPAIVDVDLGMGKSHLETEHTLRHYRECLWLPEMMDRAMWRGAASDGEALGKAQRRGNELVAEYRKPEGREETLVALRGVAERARRELAR
jgi:trimethylamine:corrinoid methyltransferase-like protein